MSGMQIRPRFRINSPHSPEYILETLASKLEDPEAPVTGKVVTHHVVLNIPVRDQHYWSPQLHMEVEEAEGGSLIRGLFGPKPTVWTFFIFMYSVIGLLGVIALTFGLSQWSIGVYAWAFWGVPLSAVLYVIVYFIARTGQHMGKEQMGVLQNFLDKAIEVKGSTTEQSS